eukprot:g11111.t2
MDWELVSQQVREVRDTLAALDGRCASAESALHGAVSHGQVIETIRSVTGPLRAQLETRLSGLEKDALDINDSLGQASTNTRELSEIAASVEKALAAEMQRSKTKIQQLTAWVEATMAKEGKAQERDLAELRGQADHLSRELQTAHHKCHRAETGVKELELTVESMGRRLAMGGADEIARVRREVQNSEGALIRRIEERRVATAGDDNALTSSLFSIRTQMKHLQLQIQVLTSSPEKGVKKGIRSRALGHALSPEIGFRRFPYKLRQRHFVWRNRVEDHEVNEAKIEIDGAPAPPDTGPAAADPMPSEAKRSIPARNLNLSRANPSSETRASIGIGGTDEKTGGVGGRGGGGHGAGTLATQMAVAVAPRKGLETDHVDVDLDIDVERKSDNSSFSVSVSKEDDDDDEDEDEDEQEEEEGDKDGAGETPVRRQQRQS